jgi:hypothetical protein
MRICTNILEAVNTFKRPADFIDIRRSSEQTKQQTTNIEASLKLRIVDLLEIKIAY